MLKEITDERSNSESFAARARGAPVRALNWRSWANRTRGSARRTGDCRRGRLDIHTGGELENGFEVTPKYIGNRRLIEVAIATLATDRALLLIGVPGTAKSWVSEHLAAAISVIRLC